MHAHAHVSCHDSEDPIFGEFADAIKLGVIDQIFFISQAMPPGEVTKSIYEISEPSYSRDDIRSYFSRILTRLFVSQKHDHWKDCPAKPHDAATYIDRVDNRAPGKQPLAQKGACKSRY